MGVNNFAIKQKNRSTYENEFCWEDKISSFSILKENLNHVNLKVQTMYISSPNDVDQTRDPFQSKVIKNNSDGKVNNLILQLLQTKNSILLGYVIEDLTLTTFRNEIIPSCPYKMNIYKHTLCSTTLLSRLIQR